MPKALRCAWVVVRALITVAVALGCLLVADTRPFRVVVALLVLIYIQNMGSASIFWKTVYGDLATLGQWIRELRAHAGLAAEGQDDKLLLSEKITVRLKDRTFDEVVLWTELLLVYAMALFFLLRALLL